MLGENNLYIASEPETAAKDCDARNVSSGPLPYARLWILATAMS